MGLDVSHDCWRGGYCSFSRWRNIIAVEAKIGTRKISMFGGPITEDSAVVDIPNIPDEYFTEDTLMGAWEEEPPDPLYVLLCHSDCDGQIMHAHTISLAQRLEAVLPKLRGMDGGGHIGNVEATTQQFIDGLYNAWNAGEDVTFF